MIGLDAMGGKDFGLATKRFHGTAERRHVPQRNGTVVGTDGDFVAVWIRRARGKLNVVLEKRGDGSPAAHSQMRAIPEREPAPVNVRSNRLSGLNTA